MLLDANQQQSFADDGFLLLKGAIPEADIVRLEKGVANNPPLDGTLDPNAPVYPNPGRYTLATQCAADPDLGFIIEHPAIVPAVEQLLGDQARLTAYVIYDRTPGGAGLPAHHDYKRWRPVGSSVNWLFTIVPFCDFDEETGPLYIAPRSHRLERVRPGQGPCMEVASAVKPQPDDFIDPGLQRGDLLLMNMHLWHRAAPNRSDRHRVGLFNKYGGVATPPATGYFMFENAVADTLSAAGKRLIAAHSDLPITSTRVVLFRNKDGVEEFYLHTDGRLPGGAIWHERAIADWDRGNFIAAAQQHLREQVQIETPWLSYIGDYPEADGSGEGGSEMGDSDKKDGLCRVYGYTLNDNGFPVAYPGTWVQLQRIAEQTPPLGWEVEAVNTWLDPAIIRGKGLSQAQSRIDQFAY